MKIQDLAVTTWTHSSYDDIWPMYYGQFKDCAPFLKHYMFINEHDKKNPADCTVISNTEEDKFYKRLTECLEQVEEKNIIYMQEDFVLYDSVEKENVEKLNDFLNNSDYSFIRLIKSGAGGGLHIDPEMGLFEVPNNCNYLYCLQATIWKKEDLIKLYNFYRPGTILDSELYGSEACRALNMKGCYIYNGEPKRGNLHYDSNIFPYISTALYGASYGKPSKWQTNIYPNELALLFEKYNIDPDTRGTL